MRRVNGLLVMVMIVFHESEMPRVLVVFIDHKISFVISISYECRAFAVNSDASKLGRVAEKLASGPVPRVRIRIRRHISEPHGLKMKRMRHDTRG
jgi:hypothetical protein